MTLEDETGNSNIVVWNAVAHFRNELLHGRLIAVQGVVERKSRQPGTEVRLQGMRANSPHCPQR